MNAYDDADAERAAERVATRLRERASALPLRAAFVEALGIEAIPAIHALIFAISTDRAEDATSLEHHETMAMVALLGRTFALEGTTPTAAHGVVPALLGALRDEGFAVPATLDQPLSVVFLEGYVRGRDERLRIDLAKRALEHVVLLALGDRVGCVVVRGEHESEPLGERLEALAREAFALDLAAVVLDVSVGEHAAESVGPSLLHFAETLASVGMRLHFVGTKAEEWAGHVGGEASGSLAEALGMARKGPAFARRAERTLVRPLRAWLRGRAERRS